MESAPHSPLLPLPEDLADALRDIYRRADAAIAATGVRCDLRGVCCDFPRAGHQLWASSLETAWIRDAHPGPFDPDSPLCPFWADGRCTERERRPLACRTYFCDPAHRDATEAIYERFHGEIRALVDRHDLEYTYANFVTALRGSPSPSPPAAPSPEPDAPAASADPPGA